MHYFYTKDIILWIAIKCIFVYTAGEINFWVILWKNSLGEIISSSENEIGAYDPLGNPHRYNGHDMDWERGHCLSSYNGNTYTYNTDGIRTSKTHNNITTTYVLNGTKIFSLLIKWNL